MYTTLKTIIGSAVIGAALIGAGCNPKVVKPMESAAVVLDGELVPEKVINTINAIIRYDINRRVSVTKTNTETGEVTVFCYIGLNEAGDEVYDSTACDPT